MSAFPAQKDSLTGSCDPYTSPTGRSQVRSHILKESKALARKKRKTRVRTWTKRPRYDGFQSTLDLRSGMIALRPSKVPPADDNPLSPIDLAVQNDPLLYSGKDSPSSIFERDTSFAGRNMSDWNNIATLGGLVDGVDSIMLELDGYFRQSHDTTLSLKYSDENDDQRDAFLDLPLSQQVGQDSQRRRDSKIAVSADHSRSDRIFQSETKPVSREQLAVLIRAIYAGLAMIESKCIQLDKAQAQGMGEGGTLISNDHWQQLIALHRTLLWERRDLFTLSQHLAPKYKNEFGDWPNDPNMSSGIPPYCNTPLPQDVMDSWCRWL